MQLNKAKMVALLLLATIAFSLSILAHGQQDQLDQAAWAAKILDRVKKEANQNIAVPPKEECIATAREKLRELAELVLYVKARGMQPAAVQPMAEKIVANETLLPEAAELLELLKDLGVGKAKIEVIVDRERLRQALAEYNISVSDLEMLQIDPCSLACYSKTDIDIDYGKYTWAYAYVKGTYTYWTLCLTIGCSYHSGYAGGTMGHFCGYNVYKGRDPLGRYAWTTTIAWGSEDGCLTKFIDSVAAARVP